MKLRKNQSGFGHIEILVVVIVVALIGTVGWFVYDRNKTKDSSTASTTAKEITNFDECAAAGNPIMESYPEQCAANGKTFVKDISNNDAPTEDKATVVFKGSVYEPPSKEYSLKLAEGWKLNRYMKESGLSSLSNDDLAVRPGVQAEVSEIERGREGIGGLFISWLENLEYEPEGVKTVPFKTDQGLDVTKYSYVETKDSDGPGLQKGGLRSTYIIKKSDNSIINVRYAYYPEYTDHQATIEQVIRTLRINK